MGRKRKREVWWRRVCRKKNGERNGDPRTIRSQNCGRDGRESRKVKYTVLCEGWVDAGGEMWESKKRGSRRGTCETSDPRPSWTVGGRGRGRRPWSVVLPLCGSANVCGRWRRLSLSLCVWMARERQTVKAIELTGIQLPAGTDTGDSDATCEHLPSHAKRFGYWTGRYDREQRCRQHRPRQPVQDCRYKGTNSVGYIAPGTAKRMPGCGNRLKDLQLAFGG